MLSAKNKKNAIHDYWWFPIALNTNIVICPVIFFEDLLGATTLTPSKLNLLENLKRELQNDNFIIPFAAD